MIGITIGIAVISLLSFGFPPADGHGMAWDPIARGSRWRFDSSAPRNYDDNGLWCGGFGTQWGKNGGRCGLCGDNFADPTPRRHELGGVFGQGVIVQQYTAGQTATVQIKITVNHRGHFYFDLCNLDRMGSEREECFERLLTADGRDTWPVPTLEAKTFPVQLRIPNTSCRRCVFRWTYVTGNNWGVCADGRGALGCGPQEHFRTCSDVSIVQRTARKMKAQSFDTGDTSDGSGIPNGVI